MTQLWILPALGAIFFWGLWGFIPKLIVGQGFSPYIILFWEGIGSLIVAFCLLTYLKFEVSVPINIGALGIFAGALGTIGALFYYMAVSTGPVNIVVSVTALYPLLTIILSAIFLHETVTIKQGLGIVFALIAVFLMTQE